ncbi:MAG: Unknown protein [uncultured Sulfurovum sp.]|uniref:SLH domain-containing protein n=1 Tax=uncultured Sulfurovum sp. TaxID=269237 RepID=A0A6S6UHD9_9BACT|nr:MAG: Unknown protein [uncultured Sulfurovum sp.]
MFFKKFFVAGLLIFGLNSYTNANDVIDDYNQDYEEVKDSPWFQTYLLIGEVANAIQLDYEMSGLFHAKDAEKQFAAIIGNPNFELVEIEDFVKQKKISMAEFKLDYQRQLQFVQEAKEDVRAVLKNKQYASNTLTPKLQATYTNLLSSLKSRGQNLLLSLEKMKITATEMEKGHINKIIEGIKSRTSFFNKIKPSSIINARTAVYLKNINKSIAWAGNALAILDIGITGYKVINNEATLKDYSSALASVAVFAGTTTAGGVVIVAEGTRSILENSIKLYSEYFDDGKYFNIAEGEYLNPVQMQQYYSYYSSSYIFESKLDMIKIHNELGSNDINIPLINAYSDSIKSNIKLAKDLKDDDTKGYLSKASFASLFGLSVDAKQINDFEKLLALDMYEYDKNISQVIISKLINDIKVDTHKISADLLDEVNNIGDLSFLHHTSNTEENTQTPPILNITLPQNATIDGYKLNATLGDTVSFQGGITASFLRGCIHDAGDAATYTLWYIDIDGQRKSLPLNFESFNQTFSFAMPSTQITMVNLAYDKNIEDDYYGSGFCGLPTVWESVDTNGTTDSNETVNLSNGLVAHYEFEGNANDSSGNGNDGTEHGGVAYVDGVIGQAGSFDGVDDYVEIAHDSSLNIDTMLTLSVWINIKTLPNSWSPIIHKGGVRIDSPRYSNREYALWLENSNILHLTSAGDNSIQKYYNTDSNIFETNKWFLYTAVIDRNTHKTKIYIDGNLKHMFDDEYSSFNRNTNNLRIAWTEENHNNYSFYNGNLDDLRIYNRALNETEIQELYALKQQDPIDLEEGLVAHYEFEGDANDSSGNGNHGTEYGGVSYVDGVIGQAGSFDGVDDHIEIDSNVGDNEQTLSVSVWAKTSDLSNDWGMIVGREYSGSNVNDVWSIKQHLNSVGVQVLESDSSEYYNEVQINDSWQQLGFIYNGNEKKLKAFKNSKIIYSLDVLQGSLNSDNLLKLFIGTYATKNYYYNGHIDDLRIYNRALSESEIQELYKLGGGTTPTTTIQTINLLNENYLDGTVIGNAFTKEWTFNKELTDLSINILENTYQNTITVDDFIKEGNTLKINLTPNTTNAINKLTLQFKNSNGEIVKVSGSDTFWSLTKINHAPRLADGQLTRLVGDSSAYLEIETYDSDGDVVTLSVEDSAGGSVSLNGNRLSASFSDGQVAHTIKIGLNDGKETVVKEFRVIDFSQNSIENYYVDVASSSEYFDAIAFGTLKGVVEGQVNSDDETQRIFRPDDNVSLAEALKIVIKAEQKAGLIELKTAEYYRSTFPTWAMPYYTFAVDTGALKSEMGNLAYIYPSRESIAQLIVKTLDLEAKVYHLDSNVSFVDEVDFSDDVMLHYAKVAKAFGLFMTVTHANPQQSISRAELTQVIQRIFMIPHATLNVSPQSIEYGETLTATLSNVQADAINASIHTLYNAVDTLGVTYFANGVEVSSPIDSHNLPITLKTLYAVLDNDGVKNIVSSAINMSYTDADNDGLQDTVDQWVSDIRYAFDENNNGIPDILDDIYNLASNTASGTTVLDSYTVNIADIIRDGGWFAPDLDDDGVSDNNDPDIDGDGVVNAADAFPRDASEWLDTDNDGTGNNADDDDDGDGVLDNNDDLPLNKNESVDTDHDGTGNNADTDDDNDGISDADERKWGFDPLDASDGGDTDSDGDGVSNKDEIEAGSDPLDPSDTKKPKKFVPIIADDLMIMIPLKG